MAGLCLQNADVGLPFRFAFDSAPAPLPDALHPQVLRKAAGKGKESIGRGEREGANFEGSWLTFPNYL